jgi:hypothetical protein
LGFEILNKIKGNFEDKLDEIEVLMSELYVISKSNEDEVELKKVKELKEKIDSLIKRVKNESVGDIYTMVCFDMTANIHKLIEDDENEKN